MGYAGDACDECATGFAKIGSGAAAKCVRIAGPSCYDGVVNGDETGVDCGGSCAACPVPPEDDTTMRTVAIAIGATVVVLCAALLLFKCCCMPSKRSGKTAPHDMTPRATNGQIQPMADPYMGAMGATTFGQQQPFGQPQPYGQDMYGQQQMAAQMLPMGAGQPMQPQMYGGQLMNPGVGGYTQGMDAAPGLSPATATGPAVLDVGALADPGTTESAMPRTPSGRVLLPPMQKSPRPSPALVEAALTTGAGAGAAAVASPDANAPRPAGQGSKAGEHMSVRTIGSADVAAIQQAAAQARGMTHVASTSAIQTNLQFTDEGK